MATLKVEFNFSLQQKYFQSYLCVEKIEKYFLKTYDAEISDEEKMYLVLHIERVVNNI